MKSHKLQSSTPTQEDLQLEEEGRIFEPDDTTKPRGKGTGRGLAAPRGALEKNGGAIEMDSEPGVGTTFQIDFPTVSAKENQCPGGDAQ